MSERMRSNLLQEEGIFPVRKLSLGYSLLFLGQRSPSRFCIPSPGLNTGRCIGRCSAPQEERAYLSNRSPRGLSTVSDFPHLFDLAAQPVIYLCIAARSREQGCGAGGNNGSPTPVFVRGPRPMKSAERLGATAELYSGSSSPGHQNGFCNVARIAPVGS
jgi:hypothetical protein